MYLHYSSIEQYGWLLHVCSFARTVITKHHKLDHLKQQKLISSEFWSPESKNQSSLCSL